jgi:hydroxyacyl-ACP dehydratase HTD2-like protein with hotdog domain
MQASKFLFSVIIINILSIDALAAQNITTNSRNCLSNSSTILVKNHSPQIKTKFTLENYSIEHQGINTLDISIQYSSFSKNTNSISYKKRISTQVDNLLKTYPNKNDYWEVMNYYLTKKIIQ